MTKREARNSKLEATPAAAIAPVRDFKAPDARKLARNLPVLTFVLLKNCQLRNGLRETARSDVLSNQSLRTLLKALADIRIRKIFSFAGRREVPRMR
jgi:hypothetical protein